MGCQQCSFDGVCNYWDEEYCEMDGDDNCIDEKGNCCVQDDPDPSYSCENYQSDYECLECGMDWNVGECNCEDD
jgi:hypothetical protein